MIAVVTRQSASFSCATQHATVPTTYYDAGVARRCEFNSHSKKKAICLNYFYSPARFGAEFKCVKLEKMSSKTNHDVGFHSLIRYKLKEENGVL